MGLSNMDNSEENINFTDEVIRDILVLHLSGRLDAISSPLSEQTVFDYIERLNHQKVIFNFASVGYLSSAGMRMLLSVSKKLKSLGGKLVICEITNNVMDVLKMSGFDNILVITGSLEEALQKF